MYSKPSKAAWRRNRASQDHATQEDEIEMFFRRIYSSKFDTFRSDILEFCEKMNIDPDHLKPRTIDEFV